MTPEELQGLQADKVIDARGTSCPGPLLAAKRDMPQVPMNGIMEVLSSDAGTDCAYVADCGERTAKAMGVYFVRGKVAKIEEAENGNLTLF